MTEPMHAENLSGYQKKSFALPYNGGDIWFEHLDGIYGNENRVLQKLESDQAVFIKPSSSAYICFVLEETTVTEPILTAVCKAIFESRKRFIKIAFAGLNPPKQAQSQACINRKGV